MQLFSSDSLVEQAWPEMVQEFFAADDVVAMLDQIGQDVEIRGSILRGSPA